jgi:hypothetical protein
MEVRLTRDYRGKETKEVFYHKGSVVAVRDDHAPRLLELGYAVPVGDDEERLAYPGLEDGSGKRPDIVSPETPVLDAFVANENAVVLENVKADAENSVVFTPVDYELPTDVQPESAPHPAKSGAGATVTRKAKDATKNKTTKRNH